MRRTIGQTRGPVCAIAPALCAAMRYAVAMRGVLVLLLAGCTSQGLPTDDGTGGWIDPGGTATGGCRADSACSGGQLCARNGVCLPPSAIHAVHVTWTLSGAPASAATCEASPDLQIWFYTSNDTSLGYAPVPCSQGKFTVDKLPVSYVRVNLARSHKTSDGKTATIDPATGEAAIDLPF
jgi:hypothetical protein